MTSAPASIVETPRSACTTCGTPWTSNTCRICSRSRAPDSRREPELRRCTVTRFDHRSGVDVDILDRSDEVLPLVHLMGTLPAPFPELAAHHEWYEQRTRAALGEQAYQAAFARGERLSLDEAVAFALDEPFPPTAAPPPADASTPLTRREQQVTDLVAQACPTRRTPRSRSSPNAPRKATSSTS